MRAAGYRGPQRVTSSRASGPPRRRRGGLRGVLAVRIGPAPVGPRLVAFEDDSGPSCARRRRTASSQSGRRTSTWWSGAPDSGAGHLLGHAVHVAAAEPRPSPGRARARRDGRGTSRRTWRGRARRAGRRRRGRPPPGCRCRRVTSRPAIRCPAVRGCVPRDGVHAGAASCSLIVSGPGWCSRTTSSSRPRASRVERSTWGPAPPRRSYSGDRGGVVVPGQERRRPGLTNRAMLSTWPSVSSRWDASRDPYDLLDAEVARRGTPRSRAERRSGLRFGHRAGTPRS